MRTDELELIPTIHSVLPCLRCLEFHNVLDLKQLFLVDMLLRLLKKAPPGHAIRTDLVPDSIYVWIDEEILRDPFWSSYPCRQIRGRRLPRLQSMKSAVSSFFKRST